MKTPIQIARKLLVVGGWAPALVFVAHVMASQVFDAYSIWPHTDIPMHLAGGCAIAFFISCCFRTLPREVVRRSRVVVLEAVLVGSLTATAAVLWEFVEFSLDQLAGTNVQVSLANTMQDIAMGMAGAVVVIFIRARQLRAGRAELRALANEWLAGRLAA